MKQNTICAISTAIGVGGISIIRVSGDDALKVVDKFFSAKNMDISNIQPRYMYLGHFKLNGFSEQCLCVYFKAPYTYTGEDLVEFQCHGGVAITNLILKTIMSSGIRLAEPGEFTKRAFLNKKISLDEAEGVIDIINAESDSELKAGYNLLQGNLQREIASIQKNLTDTLAFIDVNFDYPEYDIEDITAKEVLNRMLQLKEDILKIRNTADTGMTIKNGCRVVILGKPNVGKSSIMNALLNFDRAIVTNIQGTTRDTLEETYVFNGVKFVVIDTAGIRESGDVVEKIGVDRSIDAVNRADIVLLILDGSENLSDEDKRIVDLVRDKKVLVVLNKNDLPSKVTKNDLPFKDVLTSSALNKKGITEIKQKLYDMVIDQNIIQSNIIVTNTRHINALDRALASLDDVLTSLNNNVSLELVSVDIYNVWSILGEITGETNNEEIINSIFMNFCVGK